MTRLTAAERSVVRKMADAMRQGSPAAGTVGWLATALAILVGEERAQRLCNLAARYARMTG